MSACHAGDKPGVRRQIDSLVCQSGCTPLIAGEASTFTGYVTRIASKLRVGKIV